MRPLQPTSGDARAGHHWQFQAKTPLSVCARVAQGDSVFLFFRSRLIEGREEAATILNDLRLAEGQGTYSGSFQRGASLRP